MTIEDAASLLEIPLQEKDLLASKNIDTWVRYIAAYADYFRATQPLVVEYIVRKLTQLIGKRETARLFARKNQTWLAAFGVLEKEMFAQWKEGEYHPDHFSKDIDQAFRASLTRGTSERAILKRYKKYYHSKQ